MSPPVDPIASDPRLPDAADVVVIGGGVIGVSAALALARKGLSVAIVEKGRVGAEQSSRNWGWCRQQGRAPAEIPLARESLRLWDEAEREGADCGFRRTGVLFCTDDPKDLPRWQAWADGAREHQVHSSILQGEELAARLPGNRQGWIAALWTPSDGRAEPSRAVPALAGLARRHGATIHQACAARGLETTGGRVSAVVTEAGRICTASVLLAGGAWSSLFCRRHGIDLPIGLVNATACRTTPGPEIGPGAVGTQGVCARRRLDGGFTLAMRGRGTVEITPDLFRHARQFLPTYRERRKGLKVRIGRSFLEGLFRGASWSLDGPSPFEATRILDPRPDPALVAEAIAEFTASNPALADLRVAESWGGCIDSTPDTVPVISDVAALPGLVLATGFSGHGFGIGPASGRLAADLVTGDAPLVDPAPYSYARLVDGRSPAPSGAL